MAERAEANHLPNNGKAKGKDERGTTSNISSEFVKDHCYSKKIPVPDVFYPRIPEVFVGKSVLVTGATGFIGKVLVEKLLRSCPGIKELFILIRPSKGSVQRRLDEYRNHHVFNRLRMESPNSLNKLRALTGDIKNPSVLVGCELEIVKTSVSFVFHCAANVRFDDIPRHTLETNLVGVKNILELCKECRIIEALVHVSTAYSFCNNEIISEHVYPELVTPEQIITATQWMNDDQLRLVCLYYIQGRPSLYHFSKALAETLLVNERTVPVIIVRPSIVTASVEEPYPGWIDNYNGPSGFINVCGKGIVKTLLVNPKVNADWVPVDIVANTLIAAAHYLVIKRKFQNLPMELRVTNEVPIINCTCPPDNVITWMKVVKICIPLLRRYPGNEVYGKPGGTATHSQFIYFMCRLMYHYLPALLMDCIACLLWKKPRMITLYCKIHNVMSHMEYYTTHSFTFTSSNMLRLVANMDSEDRRVFNIDQGKVNWNNYIENYILGVRRYFLRETDDTLPSARKRMMRFHYLWLAIKMSSWFGFCMLMLHLHKRGAFKTSFFTSISVFALTSSPFQHRSPDRLRL